MGGGRGWPPRGADRARQRRLTSRTRNERAGPRAGVVAAAAEAAARTAAAAARIVWRSGRGRGPLAPATPAARVRRISGSRPAAAQARSLARARSQPAHAIQCPPRPPCWTGSRLACLVRWQGALRSDEAGERARETPARPRHAATCGARAPTTAADSSRVPTPPIPLTSLFHARLPGRSPFFRPLRRARLPARVLLALAGARRGRALWGGVYGRKRERAWVV